MVNLPVYLARNNGAEGDYFRSSVRCRGSEGFVACGRGVSLRCCSSVRAWEVENIRIVSRLSMTLTNKIQSRKYEEGKKAKSGS